MTNPTIETACALLADASPELRRAAGELVFDAVEKAIRYGAAKVQAQATLLDVKTFNEVRRELVAHTRFAGSLHARELIEVECTRKCGELTEGGKQ